MGNKKLIGTGINFRCIIEILGAPKEHIEKTLKDFVKNLKEWDTLEIVRSNYVEAVEQDKLFSMYVELTIWIKDFPELLGFCIEALPSSIEILEPDELKFKAGDLADSINDLVAKLHTIDRRLKDFTAQNTLLDRNAQILAKNLILVTLKLGEKRQNELWQPQYSNLKHRKKQWMRLRDASIWE